MNSIKHLTFLIPIAALVFSMAVVTGCNDMTSVEQADDSTAELAASSSAGADYANTSATHTYEVTVENLTGGQPFSPGILVTHTREASVWDVGQAASDLIINIAEDGATPADLLDQLRETDGVFRVEKTGVPIDDNTPPQLDGVPDPPSSATFTIEAAAEANYLSMAVMAICTNDGFVGLNGVRLPGGNNSTVFEASIYDAGSEPNTEKYTDIVDPCQVLGPDTGPPELPNGNAKPEGDTGMIQHHEGIQGVATDEGLDPELHDWDNPVARITVQRIK